MTDRGKTLAKDLGINAEHAEDMESVQKYMEEHRVPELFNEILTRLLETQPKHAKTKIVEILSSLQPTENKDPFNQRGYDFTDQKE